MEQQNSDESKKAIYRTAVRAALVWEVDRENATHNPVFWHDGALNYCSHDSCYEEVFAFLRDRGVMAEGFNSAHRLNFTFEQLDDALDADFSKGIDFEAVLGLLLIQFHFQWGFLKVRPDAGPYFSAWNEKRSVEVHETFNHLAHLGYLETTDEQSSPPHYRWTPNAAALVKKHLYDDLEID